MAVDPDTSEVELAELLVRPGTYFNPQTEVVVVVDDSTSIDQEIFDMEEYEGVEWVRISDEVPVDEDALDTTLQRFQTAKPGSLTADVSDDDEPIGADLDEEEPPPPVIEGEAEEEPVEDEAGDADSAPE